MKIRNVRKNGGGSRRSFRIDVLMEVGCFCSRAMNRALANSPRGAGGIVWALTVRATPVRG